MERSSRPDQTNEGDRRSKLRYHEVSPISRAVAEKAFASGRPEAICYALTATAYHDPDWRWVQEQCIRFASHPDAGVRGVAAVCFGHLARVHRQLDLKRVRPILDRLLGDPDVAGRAQDALDDIEIFLGRRNG